MTKWSSPLNSIFSNQIIRVTVVKLKVLCEFKTKIKKKKKLKLGKKIKKKN